MAGMMASAGKSFGKYLGFAKRPDKWSHAPILSTFAFAKINNKNLRYTKGS